MPVLFGTIRDEHIQPTVRKHFNVIEDFNPYDHLYGQDAIIRDNEFTDIQLNSLRATLEAVKAGGLPSIVYEGFDDMAEDIVAWFKKWLHKFIEFCKRAFHNIKALIIHATSKAGKFDDAVKPGQFSSFMVRGYTYTIDGKTLDTSFVTDMIKTTNDAIAEISDSDNPKAVAKAAISQFGTSDAINKLRGELLDGGEIDEGSFTKELKMYFRNGEEEPEDMNITYADAKAFTKKVKTFEKYLSICEADKKKIEDISKSIISHVGGQPQLVRRYDIYKQEHKVMDTDGAPYPNNIGDIRNDRYIAITELYTTSNRILERVVMIYDQYLTEKMRALGEAIKWYIAVLNRAKGKGETK